MSLVHVAQVVCRNNTEAVHMHTRWTVNSVFKDRRITTNKVVHWRCMNGDKTSKSGDCFNVMPNASCIVAS
jgi:hypothetical protein